MRRSDRQMRAGTAEVIIFSMVSSRINPARCPGKMRRLISGVVGSAGSEQLFAPVKVPPGRHIPGFFWLGKAVTTVPGRLSGSLR